VVRKHQPFPGLLELPLRFDRIKKTLEDEGYLIQDGRLADESALTSVHSKQYVDLLKKLSKSGLVKSTFGSLLSPYLQYYCRVSQGSYEAILASVGSCITAFDQIASGAVDRTFVLVRPPGHHASTERGEGFCLVNNVGIVARHAIDQGMKVAVVDFDRHHGNGTEEILSHYANDSLFISSFQEGCKYALRAGEAPRNSIRVPIPSYSDDSMLCARYEEAVIPKLSEFMPDIIIISAGFDMCKGDPLTNLCITQSGYGDITRKLVDVANLHCKGRVLSVLEGGYDPSLFMDSVLSHVIELAK
jgi:acetoin utilization deacetylase AcuC-like enzyme